MWSRRAAKLRVWRNVRVNRRLPSLGFDVHWATGGGRILHCVPARTEITIWRVPTENTAWICGVIARTGGKVGEGWIGGDATNVRWHVPYTGEGEAITEIHDFGPTV